MQKVQKVHALITFSKDQFWNTCVMRVTLITDNDVVLWKVCYNSQSQDVLDFHARIVTSCYTIRNVELCTQRSNVDCGIVRLSSGKPMISIHHVDLISFRYPKIFCVPEVESATRACVRM